VMGMTFVVLSGVATILAVVALVVVYREQR
jgi:hypothetical protein